MLRCNRFESEMELDMTGSSSSVPCDAIAGVCLEGHRRRRNARSAGGDVAAAVAEVELGLDQLVFVGEEHAILVREVT